MSDEALAALQNSLATIDLSTERRPFSAGFELLLLKCDHVTIRMRPEKNHALPHFYVGYKQISSASYSIDPIARLAGDLPLKYERVVMDWIAEHQKDLLATWEALKSGADVRDLVQHKPKP